MLTERYLATFVAQSSDANERASGTEGQVHITEHHHLTAFHDEAFGGVGGWEPPTRDAAASDQTPGIDLKEFLSRPVKIATLTWSDSTAVGNVWQYNPWQLFFSNSIIKRKLDNYAFIRCNLKVKVMINASPFYYGALCMAYRPLPNFTNRNYVMDAYSKWFMPFSQQPHLWIYPQKCEGCEMTLPFFYHQNWLPVGVSSNFADMGELTFVNFTALRNANGVSGTSVNIQMYAWAEDIELSGATIGFALQGLDEYGNGPISAPASAIAHIAGRLKGVPILSKFATATEIGASAVSRIAKLFGFTNVPVIAEANPGYPCPLPQLASAEIGFPVQKLTLDPKNELAIGPGHLGLPSQDELAIEHLVQRESYIGSATWTTALTPGTLLFSGLVTPFYYNENNYTTWKSVNLVPMAWVAKLFKFWRGDIIFRFRFISTQFHKGRVIIAYDPAGNSSSNIMTTVSPEGGVFTRIVDLGEENDVEIRIPYQQATAWLKMDNNFNQSFIPYKMGSTALDFNYYRNAYRDNGYLTLRVLTTLTAPVSTSSLDVHIFVRGAENLEFAGPNEMELDFSSFSAQSQDVYDEKSNAVVVIAGEAPSTPDENRYRENFGECVKSLRPLLRRTNLHEVYVDTTSSTNPMSIIRHDFCRFPLYYGYDSNGIHSAKGTITTTSNYPFNYVRNTPYHWITPAFIGQKGSMIWHFNVESIHPVSNVLVARRTAASSNATRVKYGSAAGTVSANARWLLNAVPGTTAGGAVTNQRTNAGLSVSLPSYTGYRFQSTMPWLCSAPWSIDGMDQEMSSLYVTTNDEVGPTSKDLKIWKYFSVGTDFNLYMFINVPTYTVIVSGPAAN
jgi:hypothetical protein